MGPSGAGAEKDGDESEGSEISLDDEGLDELDQQAGRPMGSGGDAETEDIGISNQPPAAGGKSSLLPRGARRGGWHLPLFSVVPCPALLNAALWLQIAPIISGHGCDEKGTGAGVGVEE